MKHLHNELLHDSTQDAEICCYVLGLMQEYQTF